MKIEPDSCCLKENSCMVLVQEMVYCVKSLYKLVVY